jgi:hypothetical protein
MIDMKKYNCAEYGTSKSVPPSSPAADARRQKDSSQDSSPWLIAPVPLRS